MTGKTLDTNERLNNDVISTRSIGHQLLTLKQPQIARTSMYDRKNLANSMHFVPVGYQVEAPRPVDESSIEDEFVGDWTVHEASWHWRFNNDLDIII